MKIEPTPKSSVRKKDGAYHSTENQDYCEGERIALLLSALQETSPGYDLELDEEDNLKVTDLVFKTVTIAQVVKPRKKAGKRNGE